MINVKNLRVTYGAIVAVHDLSLKVESASISALIGSNGAGKSSAVKSISGLLRPAGGRVEIDGIQVDRKPAFQVARRGLRLVQEGGGVFTRMTVEDNLLTGIISGERIRDALVPIYERFPVLANRRRQWGGSLSGGERQMLALGRALISRPRYLLLDEPSLGLAPRVIDQVFSMITDLRSEGIGVLLIEQNAMRALEIADYAYVLEAGRVVLEGTGAVLRSDLTVVDRYLGSRSEPEKVA